MSNPHDHRPKSGGIHPTGGESAHPRSVPPLPQPPGLDANPKSALEIKHEVSPLGRPPRRPSSSAPSTHPQGVPTSNAYPTGHSLDVQFVRRLIEGSELAWHELVNRYAGLVHSRVALVAGSAGVGHDGSFLEDLVAEVFAALLHNDSAALRAYAGRSSLATYLGVIASRVAIRRSMTSTPNRCNDLMPECIDRSAGDPQESASHSEQARLLRSLVDQLPDRQREIVKRFHLQGLSYEQISRELQIPIGSIGPTLKRAQDRLRTELEPPNPDNRPPNGP